MADEQVEIGKSNSLFLDVAEPSGDEYPNLSRSIDILAFIVLLAAQFLCP